MSSVRGNNSDGSRPTLSTRRESIISVASSSDAEEGNEPGIEILSSQINSISNSNNNNNNNNSAGSRSGRSSATAHTLSPSTNQDEPEVISLSDDEIMVTFSTTNRSDTSNTINTSSRANTPNNNNNNNNNRNIIRTHDGGDNDEILIVGEGELGQEARDRFARNRNQLTQQWQQQQRQQFEQRLRQRIQQGGQDSQQQRLPGFFSLHLPGNTIFLPTDGDSNNNNNNLRRSTRHRQVVQPPIENVSIRRRNLRQQTNNQYARPFTEITFPFGQRSAYRQLLESFDQATNGGNTDGAAAFGVPPGDGNMYDPSDNIARRTRGGGRHIPVALRRASGDVLNFFNAFGQYLPINPNEYEGFAGRMGELIQGVNASFPGGGGAESDSIPMHIMDQIRQTEEREENVRLDKRKQVANNIKSKQEESNKITEDEKEFFSNGISDKFDSICVLCGVVLGKGIPDDWNVRDGPKELTIENLKILVLNEKIPCPWQAIKGITELDKDLSKKVFFSKCGHVYCGRCINNITRHNSSIMGLRRGKGKGIDKLVQRRKKRKNFDKLGDSVSLKTIEFDSPEYSSPNACVAPNCKRKFIGKYSFKQIYI